MISFVPRTCGKFSVVGQFRGSHAYLSKLNLDCIESGKTLEEDISKDPNPSLPILSKLQTAQVAFVLETPIEI